MILLLVAALLGGVATFAGLLPYGVLIALIGMAFGSSLMALVASLLLSVLRTRVERKIKAEPDTGRKAA